MAFPLTAPGVTLSYRARSAGGPHGTACEHGGVGGGRCGGEALAEDARAGPLAGEGFGGVTLAYNARARAEVDAVLKLAQQAGGRILKPARDVFWGGYSGYFADPDGHPWEVGWNPHFELAEDGTVILPE
ncbi:MAG: VOC family protein [Sphingomonadales bacterium]